MHSPVPLNLLPNFFLTYALSAGGLLGWVAALAPKEYVPQGWVLALFGCSRDSGLLLTTPNAFSPPDSILSEEARAPLVEVRSASCHGPKLLLCWAAGLSCCTSER